jgi:uncharacterized repeat protein (TIGR01451 family)
MKLNWSQAFVRCGSAARRLGGASFAALTIAVAGAPALAADVNTLDLKIAQSPNPAIYGGSATYTVTLKNQSNKTVNNAAITVTAPSGAMFVAPGPACALSTGLPCATPSGAATSFAASGYQLPANATLTITVGYYMPAAASPPATFTLGAVGSSSNNATGPNPSAFTTVSTSYDTVFAPPPPSYPTIKTTIAHDSGNAVLWSTAACDSSNAPDCGATYYAQYLITVKNDGATDIPGTRPFNVTLTGGAAPFADGLGCSAPCSRSGNVFTITGLAAGQSTSFTVFFKSPLSPSNIDVTATVTIDTPAVTLPAPATVSVQTVPTDVAPTETYASLVPTTGGSSKAKNEVDALAHTGPFSTRIDVPTYTPVADTPVNIVLKVTPGTTACSPSSPKCLDSKLDVQSNGNVVTFGGASAPLNGTNFLVITMVRDWTTLDKKPSSVFNATVWYTDSDGNRTLIKDCANVDLTVAERCVYQRIDMTKSAKGVLTGGYLKFIIWARHNGFFSW